MLRKLSAISLLMTAAGVSAATPSDKPAASGHLRLAFSIGSLGAGPEVTYRPYRWLSIRGSASFFSLTRGRRIGGIDYSARLKLSNYGLTGDIYPFGNGWRISGGFREDNNRMLLQSTPTMPIMVGNMTYSPAQVGTLGGEITTRQYAPVATVGYAGRLAPGFSIGGDVGVLFHGRPQIGPLTSTTMLVTPLDLAAERDRVQNDIRGYRFYPVVQLSAGYRF